MVSEEFSTETYLVSTTTDGGETSNRGRALLTLVDG